MVDKELRSHWPSPDNGPDASERRRSVDPSDAKKGRIVTFYSYKGGVGRSMALANIAMLLAQDWGLDVLAVDWDLEAPGLHRFFDRPDSRIRNGVINHLDRYKDKMRTSGREISPRDLSVEPALFEIGHYKPGRLRMLAAGDQRNRKAYSQLVNSFDWKDFYERWNGAQFIEYLREELARLADVVLIDSRTGITDVGGVCTMQLPDVVVLVFSFNDQNIEGVAGVAEDLRGENPVFRSLARRPELLLLPARKDLAELKRLRYWENRAAEKLAPHLPTDWIERKYGGVLEYIRKASVPYVPYFSFGEELATGGPIGYELVTALRPLAEILAGGKPKRAGEDPRKETKLSARVLPWVASISSLLALAMFLFILGECPGR